MKVEDLKIFSEKTNNLLANINNNENFLIEPDFYDHSINSLVNQNKKSNQYTNDNRFEFINDLKEIHVKIIKGESFESLYDSIFLEKIISFIEHEEKLTDLHKKFTDAIDNSLINLNKVSKKHRYDITSTIHHLYLENIEFKHDENIDKLSISKINLLKDLHDLKYILLHMHTFNKKGDRYFYDEKTVTEKREQAEELIKYSVNIYLLDPAADNLDILTKNHINRFSLKFKEAYSEVILKSSERNMATDYLDCQNKITNTVLHSFLSTKLLTENAESILTNNVGNSKIIIFKDGSVLTDNNSQIINLININDFKYHVLAVINNKLEELHGENKNIFNNLINEDLTNIFNVMDAAIKYNKNIRLFTNDEITKLDSKDVIAYINNKVYEKNIEIYISDHIKTEYLKYINEDTINIIKTIYDCNLSNLNNLIRNNFEDIKNTEAFNTGLIRAYNLFNGFNKEEYVIKAERMKNNIIKTNDNKLIIEIKNYEQLNFFTNGDHHINNEEELKSIKQYSAYPYLVFDFDKLPNNKTSTITIILDVKQDINEYSLKSEKRVKNILDDEYKNLIDLIKSKNPKSKKKANLKL